MDNMPTLIKNIKEETVQCTSFMQLRNFSSEDHYFVGSSIRSILHTAPAVKISKKSYDLKQMNL